MKKEDILYLTSSLSQLCGIPTRIYKNNVCLQMYSSVDLVKDPFMLEIDSLKNNNSHIYYFLDKYSFYYCILKSNDYQIVLGPFNDYKINKQDIMKLAFDLDIQKDDLFKFSTALLSITIMPLETVLKALISYNFILNKEKITLEDLIINKAVQNDNIHKKYEDSVNNYANQTIRNSTLLIEKQLESFVENGNIDMFNKWLSNVPPIKAGNLSYDSLRQYKNTFIVTATLISRAAIRGGLDYNNSLDMSDNYIKKCELCTSYFEITNLNYTMIKDYIEKVAKIKKYNSFLKTKISNYVYNNISNQISLNDLCEHLQTSKSNLCFAFKKETGLTINTFILKIKIEESKLLLTNTNKTITQIAMYLGFSSQAHFTKVFKEFCNMTPLKYKQLNTNN